MDYNVPTNKLSLKFDFTPYIFSPVKPSTYFSKAKQQPEKLYHPRITQSFYIAI